ncbi:recombination protein RecR [Patescibacteria group bacterium]|nr:recombination protein RecR [Patescibacteria group bacterium]
MSTIQKLAELFSQFPGIGPRQAKRFVYFLLTRNHNFLDDLTHLITTLKKDVSSCSSCYRFFAPNGKSVSLCSICSNGNRHDDMLMIIEKDIDFENIERGGVYTGKYFILGGSVPILEKEPNKRVRGKELVSAVEKLIKENTLKEIILALSVTPAGENTAQYINELLSPVVKKHSIKISTLGRGLSTGTELEYPDSETIKNALKNRA